MQPGNTVLQALRDELSRHVLVWCEVFSGISWRVYSALDVYCSIRTPFSIIPRFVFRYCVFDRHNGEMYWPLPHQWWAYRYWVQSGQRMSFQGYGPCICLKAGVFAQAKLMGIPLVNAVMSVEDFRIFVEQHPILFDIVFVSRISEFWQENTSRLGKGKGKGGPMSIGDGPRF